VKLPSIPGLCGSHTYTYVPATSVTFHVAVPTNETVVVWLTPPGPLRWKLWLDDWSLTMIVYDPAGSDVTAAPVESVKPIT
jgi:hypothetical protein